MQYRLNMSDGQSIVISPEDFSKMIDGKGTLHPVSRKDGKSGSDSTVWVNPAHVAWVARIK